MAERATINLPLAAQLRRIHQRSIWRRIRSRGTLGAVARHVFPSRSMALLARKTQNKSALLVIVIVKRVNRIGVGGMTFKTARQDRAIKIGYAIQVSWTVDPRFQLRPVRDRKLKELISLPVKIALSFSS